MTSMELFDILGSVRDSYVAEAQRIRSGEAPTRPKKMPMKRMLLIAAIIALTLLLVGCAVVYVLSLRDMKIGEYSVTEPEHYGPNWVVIEAQEKTVEVLSVQGFADSPNQKAVKEWRDYLSSIKSEEIADEVKQEKLLEITEKYGLKLLQDGMYISYDRSQILLDALHLSGVCLDQPYAQVEYRSGTFHPEGTFDLGVNIVPDGEVLNWPYMIRTDFQYYRKGHFKYYYAAVENLDSFQEWEYTLPDGGTALLALGEEEALILAEREDGYFCVEFDSRMGIDTMTKETMEQIAGLFDFSILPHALSEEEWQTVEAEIERLDELEYRQNLEQQAQWEASLKKEGFAGWVKQTLEGKCYDDVKDMGYAFHDIDGNGVEDLLIGRDGYCTAIYWEVDGETKQFSNAATNLFVCEDQTIGYVLMPFATNYFFTRLDHGTSTGVANINYVEGHPEGEYRKYSLEVWNQYENITKEEFDSIMNSYVRIPITFLPLTEYPLDEEVLLSENRQINAESFESYEEKIRLRLTDQKERWPRWQYDIRDLNDDGVDEMIWSEDGRIWIYTTVDGATISYNMVSDGSTTPCEDGIVEAVHHYGPVNKTYRYYRLESDRAVLVDYLRYDVDANPEKPWFRSPDLTGQDITLENISTPEAMSIIASYDHLEIDMKPISEYPFN